MHLDQVFSEASDVDHQVELIERVVVLSPRISCGVAGQEGQTELDRFEQLDSSGGCHRGEHQACGTDGTASQVHPVGMELHNLTGADLPSPNVTGVALLGDADH